MFNLTNDDINRVRVAKENNITYVMYFVGNDESYASQLGVANRMMLEFKAPSIELHFLRGNPVLNDGLTAEARYASLMKIAAERQSKPYGA